MKRANIIALAKVTNLNNFERHKDGKWKKGKTQIVENSVFKLLPDVKLIFSTPVISTDKSNANENNKQFINCLKKVTFDCIHHTNITEDHLNAYGLHINRYHTRVLAKNLISGPRII